MDSFTPYTAYQSITVDVDDSVATITFHDPENYNPISTDVILDLQRAFNEIKLDRGIEVVVITGEGEDAFSSGGDIREYAGPAEKHDPQEKLRGDLYYETWKQMYDLHAVTIAKINGYCVGGGLILASFCDLAISVDSAKFGLPTANIGTTPDDGSTFRLTQLIGERAVKELVFTAKLIEADEAEELGLLNDVVPRERLDTRTEQLIENIQSNAPGAVKNSKRALNYSVQSSDMDAARDHEDSIWWEQFRSEEREQRVDQFLEE